MTTDPNAPADTRINNIVHAALRRDLTRSKTVLHEPHPPDQRRAIADHLVWMTEFLHRHHTAEDTLWPLIRRRSPHAGPILDQMEADHSRVSPAIDRVAAVAQRYRTDKSVAQELAEAVNALETELLPHLRREEDEAMPIVSRTLTNAEFAEWDQATNVAPKSKRELGIEGHWLIDSLDREGYDHVVNLVPAATRFIVLHGFARPYRKGCAKRWGPGLDVTPRLDEKSGTARHFRTEGTVSLLIDAPARVLYDKVADVTRTGERSPECRTCTWLPGPPPETPGARFRGHNVSRHMHWSRVCEVVTAEPGVAFAFRTIPERIDRTRHDSTTWSYTFTPEDHGTLVTHSYRITVLPPRPLVWLYARLFPHHTDMRPQMLQNLEALQRQVSGTDHTRLARRATHR
jgi:hemerythrin-like domain-containing protein